MRRQSIVIVAAAMLACAGTGVALLAGAARQPATKSADDAVDIAVASRQSFDVTTIATGELEARKQIEIRNQLRNASTIVEIVKEGTQVKAGDILVKLNADTIQTQVDEEQLRVRSAEADLSTAENAYLIQVSDNDSALRKAKLDLDLAELELRKWLEGEVKSKRQDNDLALERATRELERLKEKYERAVELQKQGFLSRDELKRDEVAYLEAEAALKTAQLNKRVYNEFEYPKEEKTKQSSVDEARAELDRVGRKNASQLSTREADRSNKRDQLALRQANLAKLKEQLDLTVIKAPSDGLVVYDTSLNRDRRGSNDNQPWDVGRSVPANQRLIVLPDTSEMMASVRVHESLTGRLRKGQSVMVKVDAAGGPPLPGMVDSIGVIAESGSWMDPNLREYTVKIKLETSAAEAGLKPSMRCEAEILIDKVDNALSVPISAVASEGLVRYVWTPSGDRYVRTPIRVGRRSDRFAEVLAGINEGQRVLLRVPTQGEMIERPWNKEELAAVGLNLLPDGKVAPLPRAGNPGRRPDAAGSGGGGASAAPAAPAAGGPPRRPASPPSN